MTIEETYLQFLELVNKNNTNNNVSVDKPRFVMLYNTEQIKHQQNILNKRNEDEIRTIQNFLVTNKVLTGKEEKTAYTKFNLPKDYFELASLKVEAKNEIFCSTVFGSGSDFFFPESGSGSAENPDRIRILN